ncbi:MAG: class I adenylate-forming enzyme family protein [Brevibacterium sp.]
MSDWFESRPWLATMGDEAVRPYKLEPSTTLADLADTVERHRDEIALSYYGFSLTWDEFDRYTSAFALFLTEQGLGVGDRIGIYEQNTPAFMIATYGIWKAGGSVLPLNPMYRGELEHIFEAAEVRGLVVSKAAYLDRVKPYADALPLVVLSNDLDFQMDGPERIFGKFAGLPEVPERFDFRTVVEERLGAEFTPHSPSPEDTALVMFTSGTSGKPKGATPTHANLSSNSRQAVRTSHFAPGEERYATLAPLFHITGFVSQFLSAVAGGARLILNYRFDAGAMLELCLREQPTFMVGPATVFTAMLAHPDFTKEHFASFKRVKSGGAPLPEGLAIRFEEKTGLYLGQGYGLTETCAQAASVPAGLRAPVDPASGNLACGLPQADTMIRILDDSRHPLGPDQVGEVAISGPAVVPAYLNDPEATASEIPNGELLTGDVGFMDEDGWLYIVDRMKDMINASGFKVWPREVEDVLYTHPAIQEAAVIGLPDDYRGEDVAAFVTVRPGAEASAESIIAYCRERLAAFKAPHQVTFIEELPKTSSGKILRRTIRADAVAAAEAARKAATHTE